MGYMKWLSELAWRNFLSLCGMQLEYFAPWLHQVLKVQEGDCREELQNWWETWKLNPMKGHHRETNVDLFSVVPKGRKE